MPKALRKAPLLLLLSTSVVITSGCASKPSAREQLQQNLASWVSAPVDELVAETGGYDLKHTLGNGHTVYTYKRNCMYSFTADQQDIIIDWSLGSCNW